MAIEARDGNSPSSTGYWDTETDDQLVCLDVHEETHDVRTFTFACPEGKRFAFEAGQYFLFEPAIEMNDIGQAMMALLQHLLIAATGQCDLGHRQARGGRQSIELAARQSENPA